MSDSMVERMARALCKVEAQDPDAVGPHGPNWVTWSEHARAAIEAMRDPTGGMQADGRDVIQPYLVGGRVAKPVADQWQIARETWKAMIDGALKDH